MAEAGYGANLTVSGKILRDHAGGRDYEPTAPKAIEIVRFEGSSDPDDEA